MRKASSMVLDEKNITKVLLVQAHEVKLPHGVAFTICTTCSTGLAGILVILDFHRRPWL